MILIKIQKSSNKIKNCINKTKKYFAYIFGLIVICILFFISIKFSIQRNNMPSDKNIKNKSNKSKEEKVNKIELQKNEISFQKCYLSNPNIKIIHLDITRFLIEFRTIELNKISYKENYILNGIRVMKKYLLPSLENQSCQNFIWDLILGNKANMTYINSIFNPNCSFNF